MSTLDDLIQQIRERPDDDAPRLAYADAIEAEDPERAEFIRLQIRMHGMTYEEAEPIRQRAWLLANLAQKRWLRGYPAGTSLSWHFERGFPDVVRFDSHAAFKRHHKAAFARSPRRVEVAGWRNPAELANCRALATIRELTLRGDWTREPFLALLGSPHLGPLTRLDLIDWVRDDRVVADLAACPRLAGLRRLTVEWNSLLGLIQRSDGGASALAGSPHLRELRALRLGNDCLDGPSAVLLLRSANLARLERLDLEKNAISSASLSPLANGALPALRHLNLTRNELGDGGAEILARAGQLTGLRSLSFGFNHLGPRGVVALAGARHLRQLQWLDLQGNAIHDAGAEALAGSPNLGALTGLQVAQTLIDDAGLRALGRSRTLVNLRHLNATRNAARGSLIAQVTRRFADGAPPLEFTAAEPAPAASDGLAVGPSDEHGLVRAIVADPEDDVARRVYADWLDDHGVSDLAELMRLECEGPTADDDRRSRLQGRVAEAVASCLRPHAQGVTFDRGLPAVTVRMRGVVTKAFDAACEGWLRRHHVHGLRLVGRLSDWSRLATTAGFAHVRSLNLSRLPLHGAGVNALAGSPHLGGLLELNVLRTSLDAGDFTALFGPGRLTGLVSLEVSYNRPGTDGVRALVESPTADRLTRLSLRFAYIEEAGVRVLTGSPRLGNLRDLDLSGHYVGDRAVVMLVQSPHLGRLRALRLDYNQLTDQGVSALIGSPLLPRLRLLTLEHNYRLGSSILRLARALPSGCRLSLSGSYLTADFRAGVDEILGERVTWT